MHYYIHYGIHFYFAQHNTAMCLEFIRLSQRASRIRRSPITPPKSLCHPSQSRALDLSVPTSLEPRRNDAVALINNTERPSPGNIPLDLPVPPSRRSAKFLCSLVISSSTSNPLAFVSFSPNQRSTVDKPERPTTSKTFASTQYSQSRSNMLNNRH